MQKHYIRFGEIPTDERSKIYRGETQVGEELGVSAYDAICIDGEWRIVLPYELKPEVGFDLHNLINSRFQTIYKVARPNKVYLLTGDEVGKGATNEPLLRNVKIVKELYTEK